jgi:hypothetical protein
MDASASTSWPGEPAAAPGSAHRRSDHLEAVVCATELLERAAHVLGRSDEVVRQILGRSLKRRDKRGDVGVQPLANFIESARATATAHG